ncbi:MAG: alpha/beta hydrolase [Polyangiales bacterium]
MIDRNVRHRWLSLDGVRVFYREAGPANSPVLLLPHGYPCSSFVYRAYMRELADRYRLIAPDFPGFGYSDTPEDFAYDFDGYADFLARFAAQLSIARYALYLHDYGSQIGLRLAIRAPDRVAGLIVQNGDIYADTLGPRYQELLAYFAKRTPEARAALERAVSEEGFRDECLNDVSEEVAARIAPELWSLHWPLMNTPARRALSLGLMEKLEENLGWFPRYQRYLREHQPKTLIAWGPRDGYMPEASGRAYLRDLPDATFHLFEDGGHWLLETHLDELVAISRAHLARVFEG